MTEIHGFPKIFHIGDRYIPDLFKGVVEVTEKVDGSQFGFGISAEGALVCRSKGKELFVGAPEKMFAAGVAYVTANEAKIREVLKPNSFIYGEFLGSPSHNILKYGRVPQNHIIVFGALIENAWVSDYEALKTLASSLDLETVPLVFKGEVTNHEELTKLFEADSVLGAEKIEGVVIKNYDSPCFLGSIIQPSFAKYVRAEFKERHASDWGPKFNGHDKMAMLIESVKTEARWHKAIQHLKEKGELLMSPRDIGKLMKEIEEDLTIEEKENLKEQLWRLNREDFMRKAVQGFPIWYKDYLAKKQFETIDAL